MRWRAIALWRGASSGARPTGPTTATSASTASPAPTTTTAAEPQRLDGLTAILWQYREDEIQGLLSVKTTNRSASTVTLEDLHLQWPGLTDAPPLARPTQFAPGVTFDLRVRVATAVCGDPPTLERPIPSGDAVAIGRAAVDGAAPVEIAIPIDDEAGILPKIYRRSCRDQRLAWAAELRFGDRWTPTTTPSGGPAVAGTLELRRRQSDERLAITRINGSVLLSIDAASAGDPVAILEPGEQAVSVPILVSQSGNCSAHALIESKKTFIIPIGFAIGDDEPTDYVVTFDVPARDVINPMINESCGLG